jgi:hypothetical protein
MREHRVLAGESGWSQDLPKAIEAIRVGVSSVLKTGLDLFERIHGFQSERFVPLGDNCAKAGLG